MLTESRPAVAISDKYGLRWDASFCNTTNFRHMSTANRRVHSCTGLQLLQHKLPIAPNILEHSRLKTMCYQFMFGHCFSTPSIFTDLHYCTSCTRKLVNPLLCCTFRLICHKGVPLGCFHTHRARCVPMHNPPLFEPRPFRLHESSNTVSEPLVTQLMMKILKLSVHYPTEFSHVHNILLPHLHNCHVEVAWCKTPNLVIPYILASTCPSIFPFFVTST